MFTVLTESNYGLFISKSLEYPVANMFCGLVNPSPKDKKLEQRVIQICESLYRIDNFLLAEVRNAWREVNVLSLMTTNHLKPEYCVTVFAKLDAVLKIFEKKFSALGKQEPQLKQYIENIHLVLKNEKSLFVILNECLNNEDLKLYAEKYKSVSKEETARITAIEGTSK